jgi:cell division protein ZapD
MHSPLGPADDAAERLIVYEQPLNERMRTFLRVEFLYQQALYHVDSPATWSSRAAVGSLLDILAIIGRGETRNDVLKELERQMALLRDYAVRAGVDSARLSAVLARLVKRRDELAAAAGASHLRDSEFLAAIKHRSAIPGGTCEFDLPDYYHWLNLPPERRRDDFLEWLGAVRPLCDSIVDLLWVARENSRPRAECASGGVFQIVFEREAPIQLLRIGVAAGLGLYPEISGSHHRCSIRFMSWNDVRRRPAQGEGDVRFVLTCCS